MPYIAYQDRRFNEDTQKIIDRANEIIASYAAQGFDLTLRQLYYQFVSRNWLVNSERSYKRLGDIISNGRLAGLIDWDSIIDRTRFVRANTHWSSSGEIIRACAGQYMTDRWRGQEYRPEVWIEKDALVGVFDGVCRELDVPLFACRGYASQSEVWAAGHRRLRTYVQRGETPIILHFGDHDPSGIDMTRDIGERLRMFAQGHVEVERIALTMEQVEAHSPPPNPAKTTDARFESYRAEYGEESWELDALDPAMLADLVREHVAKYRDDELWNEVEESDLRQRKILKAVATNWQRIEKDAEKRGWIKDDEEDEEL